MLLVLSSMNDPYVAPALIRWRAAGIEAHALTCHDLAQPGWRLTLTGSPTLVVGGKPVPAAKVTGVITRLSWVTSHELPFMDNADRDYAAAEMQGFLLALLSRLVRLEHPVLNRPTPGCLSGPSWSHEHWVSAVAAAGVAVEPVVHAIYAGGAAAPSPSRPRRIVTVVGDQVFGDANQDMARAAVAVARAAGTDLLRIAFAARAAQPTFLDADVLIDLSDDAIADAVAGRFR